MAHKVANPIENPIVDRNRNQFVDRLMNQPKIDQNAVSNFAATPNATTKGIDVSFRIVNESGLGSVTLLRASVLDIKQAVVLQTWTGNQANFTWSDTDATLQKSSSVYYWVRLEPATINGAEVTVGPQQILLNPSLLPPVALSYVSASHDAVSSGTVLVTVNVSAVPPGDQVKIYVSNYLGNAAMVALAQGTAPMQFRLQQTGEIITITAIAVSAGGTEATSGPTCNLTLNAVPTSPAQVQNISVIQISAGNQLQWPSSVDNVTSYDIFRGPRGGTISSAPLLVNVPSTTEGTVFYLDTGGLANDYEYYIKAKRGATSGPASVAANPLVVFSSAQIPGNIPTNANNNATVDSIDNGTGTTIRIYGPGGVSTNYTRYSGYGNATRSFGFIVGTAYATVYWVMYTGGTHLALTSYPSVLPDNYEWVAKITTVAAGGGGGSTGGGGSPVGPQGGCVELGTLVVEPEGTEKSLEPCDEWISLDLGEGALKMHPKTLVSVWKEADELTSNDRIEVQGARWKKPIAIGHEVRPGTKVKRTCPGGTYHAGPSLVRLHNVKQY